MMITDYLKAGYPVNLLERGEGIEIEYEKG